jgi:hypothetical protein
MLVRKASLAAYHVKSSKVLGQCSGRESFDLMRFNFCKYTNFLP